MQAFALFLVAAALLCAAPVIAQDDDTVVPTPTVPLIVPRPQPINVLPKAKPVSFDVASQWYACPAASPTETTMFGLRVDSLGTTTLFALHSSNPFASSPSWESGRLLTIAPTPARNLRNGSALAYCDTTHTLLFTLNLVKADGSVDVTLNAVDLKTATLSVKQVGLLPGPVWGATCFNGVYYYAERGPKSAVRAVELARTTGLVMSNRIFFNIPILSRARPFTTMAQGDLAFDPSGQALYLSGTYYGIYGKAHMQGLWRWDVKAKQLSSIAVAGVSRNMQQLPEYWFGGPTAAAFGQITANEAGALLTQDYSGRWYRVDARTGALTPFLDATTTPATDVTALSKLLTARTPACKQ